MQQATQIQESFALGGAITERLLAELREKVRQHGIVIWLDHAGAYSELVDRLIEQRSAGAFPYDIFAFRGSYLELMLKLEGVAGGAEKVPLVIHLPGFGEESVKQSPLLELYAAGVRFRKSLVTLINEAAAGLVKAEELAAFTDAPGLTLERADAWLNQLLNESPDGLSGRLRRRSLISIFDELLEGKIEVSQPDDIAALWEHLSVAIGLPEAWRENALPAPATRSDDIAFAGASWALAVEYVHDLSNPEPKSEYLVPAVALEKAVVQNCRDLAKRLRTHHPRFYQQTADETEALLSEEIDAAKAKDLGKVDTFRFEETKILKAAIASILDGDYTAAARWAELRIGAKQAGGSFWLSLDPLRESAWQLVHDAARLGEEILRAGAQIGVSPNDDEALVAALDAYTERGAAVDRAHRKLEQRAASHLFPKIPEFESIRAGVSAVRKVWRTWADAWAIEFNALCRAQGFLPRAAYQQRTLFDDVVRPFSQEVGITAYFMVDALRYEMGEQLFREIDGTPATSVQLRARLAELPSVTEVGMNVLAPVSRGGRLRPVMESDRRRLAGFMAGSFRVNNPKTRRRAMQDRVGGRTCPWLTLEEVIQRDSESLKSAVTQAKLVVVHSEEIDKAGENGAGPAVFEKVIQQLRAAWQLLREAGVRRFVFTADHGFLLRDESEPIAQLHGGKLVPQRRHVFSTVAAEHRGEASVPLSALGYEDISGHLMFPETTAVFDMGKRDRSFVHGGNSLQERVIPVLTVVHRAASGGSTLSYSIRATVAEAVGGMHCIEAAVELTAQRALDFGSPNVMELALRVPEGEAAEGVEVEVVQVRGGQAKLKDGLILAKVDERFEIFFRLLGATDAKVLVELYHPSAAADVEPAAPEERFAVTAMARRSAEKSEEATARSKVAPSPSEWLQQYEGVGERRFFEHLSEHGIVDEREATEMLGGPRAFRRFTREFEDHVKKAPFSVRIDAADGMKRYVREGKG